MKKVFTEYYMADEERLNGFTIANVSFGINEEETGMLIELEREINGAVVGIDILYDPDNEELEEALNISEEYLKKAY
ncbi:MAG: hypothetical protein HFG96_11340 [Lachnospiraceae bacterium]|jgi:hypothetical protein|nr:hypothetical protein [Lachnospiraceae bacterium]